MSFSDSRQVRRGDRPTLPPIRDLFRDELSRLPRARVQADPLSLACLSVNDDPDDSSHHDRLHSQSFSSRSPPRRSPSTPPRHPFALHTPAFVFPQPQTHASDHRAVRPQLSQPTRPTKLPINPGPSNRPSETVPFVTHHTSYDFRGAHHPSHQSNEDRLRPRTATSTDSSDLYGHVGSSSEENLSLADRHYTGPNKVPYNVYRTPSGTGGFPRPRTTISTAVSQFDPGRHQSDDERTPVARYGPKAVDLIAPAPTQPSARNGSSSTPSKYQCTYCGKGFNRPSSLKIHLNSHTGEKPFVCPVEGCRRSFSVLSNMRRHARVHTQPSQKELEGSGEEGGDAPRKPSHLGQFAAMRGSPPLSERSISPRSFHARRDSSASSGSSRRSRMSSPDDDDDGRPEKRVRHTTTTITS